MRVYRGPASRILDSAIDTRSTSMSLTSYICFPNKDPYENRLFPILRCPSPLVLNTTTCLREYKYKMAYNVTKMAM